MSSNSSGNNLVITTIVFVVLALALGICDYFTVKVLSETKSRTVSIKEEHKKLIDENNNLKKASNDLRDLLGIGYTDTTDFAALAGDLETLSVELANQCSSLTGSQSGSPKTCIDVARSILKSLEQEYWLSNSVLEGEQAFLDPLLVKYGEENDSITKYQEFLEEEGLQKDISLLSDLLKSEGSETVDTGKGFLPVSLEEIQRLKYEVLSLNEEKKTKYQRWMFDVAVEKQSDENKEQLVAANGRYDELSQLKTEQENRLQEIKAEAEQSNARYQTQMADSDESKRMIIGINETLQNQIAIRTDPIFEIPDGKIIYVDQINRIVHLNVGKADGVQLLTTFGVYASDALEKGTIQSKGSLEVTRVVDEHQSEARILDDEMQNPFTPGDFIYTPIWKAGNTIKVALDYFLDIDKDNKDDLDQLIRVINRSGGKVEAWISETGDLQGKVSSDATYLIVSDTPIHDILDADFDTPDEVKGKILASHTELMEKARYNGLRPMSLSEFLLRSHYKQSAEISRYQEPDGVDNEARRSGVPISSHAAIAPIYDQNTKDARPSSFGVTAPIYNPNRVDSPQHSSGRVSDTYFKKRSPKEL